MVIIFYPALPKLLFNHSMNNSDIPCLIEGANTTSFALQYGIPYLSVLPNGNTPIPKTIGDPLQSLLIEALSCKLSMTDEELNYMSTLHSYIKQKNYRMAKIYILSLLETLPKNSILWFIYNDHKTDSTDIFNTNTISIESLIDKAYDKNSLSTIVYNCLLQATDDIYDSIVQYIKNHQDPNSLERRHTQMLRDHVNLPMNDTIAMSLHRFANEVRRETSDHQLK